MRFERESEILGKLIARGLYFSEQLLLILKKTQRETNHNPGGGVEDHSQ